MQTIDRNGKNMLYSRENYLRRIRGFYDKCDLIKVITGIRRCGKSSIMQLISLELKKNGVKSSNIIYLPLDRKPYIHITTAEQLDTVIEEKSQTADTGTKFLFIDEIQNVKDFETIVNAYRETGDFSIFITGSNSYLLSGELMTKLTGRYIEFEIFPLSFEEYVGMKKHIGAEVSANSMSELNSYILDGGFPYTLFLENINDKREYTANLINEIWEKDIRKRVKIKNRAVFDAVTRYFVNNFGVTSSISNILDELKKNGIAIKMETLGKYVTALVNAKILYACNRFDLKSKKSLRNEKKYYLTDLSFYYSANTDNRVNYGPTLENVVYTYARSKNYSVSIGKIGKFECDFIVRGNDMEYAYIQVAYTILGSRETEDREYRCLEMIKDNYPKYVMTCDFLLQKRNGIKHVTLPEFLSNGEMFT